MRHASNQLPKLAIGNKVPGRAGRAGRARAGVLVVLPIPRGRTAPVVTTVPGSIP